MVVLKIVALDQCRESRINCFELKIEANTLHALVQGNNKRPNKHSDMVSCSLLYCTWRKNKVANHVSGRIGKKSAEKGLLLGGFNLIPLRRKGLRHYTNFKKNPLDSVFQHILLFF